MATLWPDGQSIRTLPNMRCVFFRVEQSPKGSFELVHNEHIRIQSVNWHKRVKPARCRSIETHYAGFPPDRNDLSLAKLIYTNISHSQSGIVSFRFLMPFITAQRNTFKSVTFLLRATHCIIMVGSLFFANNRVIYSPTTFYAVRQRDITH